MKRKKLLISIFIFMTMIITFGSLSFASSDIIVALDPGHGGDDPGAMGGNLKESDLNWKIASRVKEILDETPGITGVLTKSQYETVDEREERARRAVENNADLLVSFHINSNDSSSSLSGAEVYITHSTAERRFYEYSNRLGLDILSNLRSVGVQSHSPKPLVRVGADWDKYDDGTIADYYGIISWPMHMGIPGMIIEHAFINNPYDRANYLNDTMLNRMAEADAQAIIKNKELFRREYVGNINTDLQTMQVGQESDGRYYITGNVLVAEWIDGVANVPKDLPKMTIKSTDGTFSAGVNLVHEGGLNYSYYRIIDNLDINKEYYLEATLTSEKNVSTNKTQRVNMQNLTAGEYKGTTVKTKNNTMYFSVGEYVGDINTDLKEIKVEDNQIKGNMLIAEYINNVANTPKKIPTVVLKSTDNAITIPATLEHKEGLAYSFSFVLDKLDLSKQYYVEATLNGLDNIGINKVQQVILPEQELGTFNGRKFITEGNLIKPTYVGAINTDLQTMNLALNGSEREYISGEILIAEWINGVANEPQGLPKMILRATDGSYSAEFHLVHNGGLSYSYDRVVYNLKPDKEYEIEVQLTGNNNKGTEKTQIVQLESGEIGKVGTFKLVAEDNKLRVEDGSLYVGAINTDLKTMKIGVNEVGREYISGEIIIAEWVDGVACEPQGLPTMTLKSTDGEYSAGMHVVSNGGLNYSYDRVIYNLDTSKTYYIEVELTGEKNIGENKVQKANLNAESQVGEFKDTILTLENNEMIFKAKESKPEGYIGTINTDLKTMNLELNGSKLEYITGEILIAEWIDGVACEPQGLPKMTLKATDGSYSAEFHLVHNGGLSYTYDRVVYNLKQDKEYEIEVELTGKNNIGTRKTQITKLPNGEIGKVNEFKLVAEDNKLRVEDGSLYVGAINTDLKTMKIGVNEVGREYISGEILIAEWIDGVACEPQGLPKMTIKSTDGTYNSEFHVVSNGGLSYTYDRVIYNLDTTKEYYIEVELTGEKNIGTNKVQRANLNAESEVGTFKDTTRLVLRDNMMIFEPVEIVMLIEEPKVEDKEEVRQEENKVEQEQTEITNKQEEVKDENEEEIPEVIEDEEQENNKQEENEIKEKVTENTNIVENTTNIINIEE